MITCRTNAYSVHSFQIDSSWILIVQRTGAKQTLNELSILMVKESDVLGLISISRTDEGGGGVMGFCTPQDGSKSPTHYHINNLNYT